MDSHQLHCKSVGPPNNRLMLAEYECCIYNLSFNNRFTLLKHKKHHLNLASASSSFRVINADNGCVIKKSKTCEIEDEEDEDEDDEEGGKEGKLSY